MENSEIERDALWVLMEEYKTLRQESMDAIKTRTQIVSFGLASSIFLISAPSLH
jgi:hypothetical protein